MWMQKQKKTKDLMISYSFVLPFTIFFFVFMLFPILYVFYLSFHNGTFLNMNFTWAGIKNFRKVVTNKDFINAFRVSLLYIIVEVPVSQIYTLALAILLRKKNKINAVYETIYFLPMLISMVAAGVVIAYVLSTNGPLNYLVRMLGMEPITWFGDPTLAQISVMLLELWKGGNFFVFVYVAALRALPIECSEAARIDGASAWQELIHITLPLMRNSIVLCVTMNTIWQFQVFESVYTLTGGGPLKSTETVVYTIYQYSFMHGKIGVGAAAAVLFLLIIVFVSLLENMLFRDRELARQGREG